MWRLLGRSMSALCSPGSSGRLGSRPCHRRSSLLFECCTRTEISPAKGRAGRAPPLRSRPRVALFVSSSDVVAVVFSLAVAGAAVADVGIVSAGAQLPVVDKFGPERSPPPPRCTRSCQTMQLAAVEQVGVLAAADEVLLAMPRGHSRPSSPPVHGSGRLSPELMAGPERWQTQPRLMRQK